MMGPVNTGHDAARSPLKRPRQRWLDALLRAGPRLLAILVLAVMAVLAQPGLAGRSRAQAQTAEEAPPPPTAEAQSERRPAAGGSVLQAGDVVVTGFSGVKQKQGDLTTGAAPLDAFFIDPDGASAQAFRLDPGAPPKGQLINAPVLLQIKAREVGQVFGVTFDDAPIPNVYLAATSAYGLHIVVDEGVGQKRVARGQAGAAFMPGQFGDNGGPGGIWKVDGATGAVSVFATIPGNRGPALGDIAYDPGSGLFFASDFDTGLIHRIDGSGKVLDAFDHGVNGRRAEGLDPIADDGAVMTVTYPAFDSENPATWGLTQPERRVWGLAVYAGRLYYAVWGGPQVWSVGVNRNGFASDARLEFQLTGGEAAPIAHMTFSRSGELYLAQRGGVESAYNYSVFAKSRSSRVLRYRHSGGKWRREDYAIGFPPRQQNAAGGVALGHGYDARGRMDSSRCDATLWATGDALRNDPARAADLKAGGAAVVHGLQGADVSWVRPADAPARAWFVDYDGTFGDAEAEGHVGSAAIRQACAAGTDAAPATHASEGDAAPGQPDCPGCEAPQPALCAAGDPRCVEAPCDPNDPYCSRTPCDPHDPYCHRRNLKIAARPLSLCHKTGGAFVCGYRITVTNTGPDDYDGLIRVREILPHGGQLAASGGPEAPCNLITNICATPTPVHLAPGGSLSFPVRVRVSSAEAKHLRCHVHNRARIIYAPSGSNANSETKDDDASAVASIPDSDCETEKANLQLAQRAEQCVRTASAFTCVYDLRFTNTGPGDYRGPIAFSSTAPSGTTATVISPTFACSGGPALSCASHAAVNLARGASVGALVKITTPHSLVKALRCSIPNVVHINQAAGGSDDNADPGDDTAMATASIPAPACVQDKANLRIEQQAGPCARTGAAFTCLYDLRYANTGPSTYQGVLSFTATLPAGAAATFLSPDFTCVGGPAYTCASSAGISLAPGASGGALIKAAIPLDAAKALNCHVASTVQILLPPPGSDQNTDSADDSARTEALAPPPGCIPQAAPEQETCPEGMVYNPGTDRCWTPPAPAGAGRCPEGSSGSWPECQAIPQCPEGSKGRWPRCEEKAGTECPPQWSWDGQRCAPIDAQRQDDGRQCPEGFDKVGGRCVRQPQATGSIAPGDCKEEASSPCAASASGAEARKNQDAAPEEARTHPPHESHQGQRRGDLARLKQSRRRALQQRQRQRAQMHMIRQRSHVAARRERPQPFVWPWGIFRPAR